MGQEQLVVRFTYGSHVRYPIQLIKDEGQSVTVKDVLAQTSVFGVPANSGITVNGEEGNLDTILQNADEITFCKATGRKAWPKK